MPMLRSKPISSSNIKLLRIAGYIGLVGSSAVLIMKWYSDRRVRKSDFYVKATQHLLANQPTVDLFGPPIYFGNVNFHDKKNFNTPTEMRVLIPVTGSKNRGMLYTKAVRPIDIDDDVLGSSKNMNSTVDNATSSQSQEQPLPSWRIEQLEVTLDNRPGESARIPLERPIVLDSS